jgi:ATP-dependent DNA helicase RecQ
VAKTKVRVALSLLKDAGLVRETRGVRFKLVRPEVTPEEVECAAAVCAERGEGDRVKLERVMLYGQSAECRWKLLHEYFGEPFEQGSCGHCDNCVQPLEERLGLTPRAAGAPAGGEPPLKVKKVVELNEGDAVRLPKYGRGRVAALDGDKVSVEFPGGETRTFKREFVRRA